MCILIFLIILFITYRYLKDNKDNKDISKIRGFSIYKSTLPNRSEIASEIQKHYKKVGLIPSSDVWLNGDHLMTIHNKEIATSLFKTELVHAITSLKIPMSNISLIDPKSNGSAEDYWVNFYTKGHKQGPHRHVTEKSRPICSFTYFVKYDEKKDAPLRFYTDTKEYLPAKERSSFTLDVREGDIIFFHPLLEHSVDEQKSSEPRITVSGNIYSS